MNVRIVIRAHIDTYLREDDQQEASNGYCIGHSDVVANTFVIKAKWSSSDVQPVEANVERGCRVAEYEKQSNSEE